MEGKIYFGAWLYVIYIIIAAGSCTAVRVWSRHFTTYNSMKQKAETGQEVLLSLPLGQSQLS